MTIAEALALFGEVPAARARLALMDETGLGRIVEQLEAHLDGLRVAGAEGLAMAEERFREYPEAGELFLLRMLQPQAMRVPITTLDLAKVRSYLADRLDAEG